MNFDFSASPNPYVRKTAAVSVAKSFKLRLLQSPAYAGILGMFLAMSERCNQALSQYFQTPHGYGFRRHPDSDLCPANEAASAPPSGWRQGWEEEG